MGLHKANTIPHLMEAPYIFESMRGLKTLEDQTHSQENIQVETTSESRLINKSLGKKSFLIYLIFSKNFEV